MENKSVPSLLACLWWDNKGVNFLNTGGSFSLERVARREKDGSQTEVPCPKLVKNNHKLMGGGDIHDQLRLQRYSLQLAVRCQKYYKSLFLGLVDIGLVNSYIAYKVSFKQRKIAPKLSHVMFLKQLHLQLIQLTDADVSTAAMGASMSPQIPRQQAVTRHVAAQINEWQDLRGGKKTALLQSMQQSPW